MATYVTTLNEWFWSEKFWLPPNNTWADLRRDDTIYLPQGHDLWIIFPFALVLFVIRLGFERFIATPIGIYYNLKEEIRCKPTPCPLLEEAYKTHKRLMPKHDVLTVYADKIGWQVRHVERWWRRRKVLGKPSEMQRFRETLWRFTFYLLAFIYGIYILHDKPYFYDTKHFWYDYPRQHVPSEIWWYYMIELGFYWSLIISLFMDTRRKDFAEMMIHHLVTILLMWFSWVDNMVRVGAMVLVIHDAVDPWLEGAKLLKYMGFHRSCDVVFLMFSTIWFITRLTIYPYQIVWPALFEGAQFLQFFKAYYVYNGLIMLLQVLHILWFIMIFRMVLQCLQGELDKDDRSDTEPEPSSGEEDGKHMRNGKKNGIIKANNNMPEQNGVSGGHGNVRYRKK